MMIYNYIIITTLIKGRGRVEFDIFLSIATRKILNRNPQEEILKTFDLFELANNFYLDKKYVKINENGKEL